MHRAGDPWPAVSRRAVDLAIRASAHAADRAIPAWGHGTRVAAHAEAATRRRRAADPWPAVSRPADDRATRVLGHAGDRAIPVSRLAADPAIRAWGHGTLVAAHGEAASRRRAADPLSAVSCPADDRATRALGHAGDRAIPVSRLVAYLAIRASDRGIRVSVHAEAASRCRPAGDPWPAASCLADDRALRASGRADDRATRASDRAGDRAIRVWRHGTRAAAHAAAASRRRAAAVDRPSCGAARPALLLRSATSVPARTTSSPRRRASTGSA